MFSTEDLTVSPVDLDAAADGEAIDNSWSEYRTATEIGLEDHLITGELSTYPNSGYSLMFDG